ncbi:uncharacterized protein F5147DRAFT_565122, partial [Suillus discolor]
LAFKYSDFKICSHSGLRTRPRSTLPSSWRSPYSMETVSPHRPGFAMSIHSSIYPNVKFVLGIIIHEEGIVCVRMDEGDGLRKRYNEAAQWVLLC